MKTSIATSTPDSESMTADERGEEAASILARGLARFVRDQRGAGDSSAIYPDLSGDLSSLSLHGPAMNGGRAGDFRDRSRMNSETDVGIGEQFEELHGHPTRSRPRRYLIRKIAWRIPASTAGDLFRTRPQAGGRARQRRRRPHHPQGH